MSLLSTYRNALPTGTRILWYRIDQVLGQGAFGITYLATDDNLHRSVAIKEYLPGHLARRETDNTIQPLTTQLSDEYTTGLYRFLSEARTLARFEHPNIVRVHNVFEHNRTAYMVMQHEEGEGLDRVLRQQRRLPEEALLAWLPGLLDGLETIHAQGYVHRDIKPANVLIRTNGEPVLLDFGSARHATPEEAKTLTNFVSPGYAPIEQYAGKSDQQGPWTDIYGLGATLYRAMAGRPPPDAVERSHALAQQESDTYQPDLQDHRRDYSVDFVKAVDHALCFRTQDRPQTIAAWRSEFTMLPDEPAAGRTRPPTVRSVDVPTLPSPTTGVLPAATSAPDTRRARRGPLAVGAALLLALGLVGVLRLLPSAPSSVVSAPNQIPAPTVVPAPAPDPLAVANPALTLAARVEDLLGRAALDLEAARLTLPPGDNAYEKYRDVLTLDPTNVTAQQGIAGIARRYLDLAQRDIEAGEFQRADTYLRRAEALNPGQPEAMAARELLTRKRREPPAVVTTTAAADAGAPISTPADSVPTPATKAASGWRAPIEERVPPAPAR
jgi:serine/threonine protein kinase